MLRGRIEMVLRELKYTHTKLSKWTCRQKAAFLAGLREGLELAHELVELFVIKPGHRVDWGKQKGVQQYLQTEFAR